MEILIVGDHHHINGLEEVVNKNADKADLIIAAGDFSVTQRTASQSDSTLKKYQDNYKQKHFSEIPIKKLPRMNLNFEDKKKAIEEGITQADKKEFEELILWYGTSPIFNLGRKIYSGNIMEKLGKKLIVFKGSEPVISYAQQIIYERIQKEGCQKDKVIEHLIDSLISKRPDIFEIIRRQITIVERLPEIKEYTRQAEEFKQSLKDMLSMQNFGGEIPTSEAVYQTKLNLPGENSFQYLEEISWEKIDKTTLIKIPYFKDREESTAKMLAVEDGIIKLIRNSNTPYCTIISHSNPSPAQKMNRSRGIDDNKEAITTLCRKITQEKRYPSGNINMVTFHLHQTYKRYSWAEIPVITIKPVGPESVVRINTQNNRMYLTKQRTTDIPKPSSTQLYQ